MNLSPLTQSFVLHFGEMGNHWGISRTVGQIYALLFLSEHPLNADQIAEQLNFSRSNVSMGLKELNSWNLIRLQHLPNDRREYFSTPEDIWLIFKTLAVERQKREIAPTLTMLRSALMTEPTNNAESYAQTRMQSMHEFIELITLWFDDIQNMDPDTLQKLLKLGSKVQKFMQLAQSITNLGQKNN